MNVKGEHLYLKPDEAKFISIAIVSLIEQLQETSKNPETNWNPGARKDLKDMLIAGNSLKLKLQKLGFNMRNLPDAGDIGDFLTKES